MKLEMHITLFKYLNAVPEVWRGQWVAVIEFQLQRHPQHQWCVLHLLLFPSLFHSTPTNKYILNRFRFSIHYILQDSCKSNGLRPLSHTQTLSFNVNIMIDYPLNEGNFLHLYMTRILTLV